MTVSSVEGNFVHVEQCRRRSVMNYLSSRAVVVLLSLLLVTVQGGVSNEVNSTVHVESGGKESGSSYHDSGGGVGHQEGGVRWDMVAIGVGVILLLLIVLAVSGVVTYAYRNTNKNRQRSRYIHQVLQMYEDASDSSGASDYSIDDDPETNNLFERL